MTVLQSIVVAVFATWALGRVYIYLRYRDDPAARRSALLWAVTMVVGSTVFNVYAIRTEVSGAAWVATICGLAALAIFAMLNYYREEAKS